MGWRQVSGHVDPLILKLLLTPTLVLLVALAQRRLGERIGGRLAALPPTSGPLVLVVVCGQGSATGRALVEGILTGVPAAVVFFVVYAALADRQRWWTCAATATVASVLTGGVLARLRPPTWLVLTALVTCWLAPAASHLLGWWERDRRTAGWRKIGRRMTGRNCRCRSVPLPPKGPVEVRTGVPLVPSYRSAPTISATQQKGPPCGRLGCGGLARSGPSRGRAAPGGSAPGGLWTAPMWAAENVRPRW